jgi:hypothetical protein
MFHKVRDVFHAHGVSGLLRQSIASVYWRLRPYLLNEPVRYAGIPICYDRNWIDRIVPSWIFNGPADQPGYEVTLLAGLRETIKPGDRVIVIGGGVGVTAVVAALRTGAAGTVQCFEASKRYVELIQQTVARNSITNVKVHHAVVAKAIGVYNDGSDNGPTLSPSQLPSCDVLELDCEGAEVDILRQMSINPRVVLVETHGMFGAPTSLIASLLEKRGYVVSDRGLAEANSGWRSACIRNDVRVLLGIIGSCHE